jgi:hypothetical protein
MRRIYIVSAVALLGIAGAGYYYYHMTCCAPQPVERPMIDQGK